MNVCEESFTPFLNHHFAVSFEVVGYGCMTCIGNSGPLPDPLVEAITQVPTGFFHIFIFLYSLFLHLCVGNLNNVINRQWYVYFNDTCITFHTILCCRMIWLLQVSSQVTETLKGEFIPTPELTIWLLRHSSLPMR